MTLIEDNQWQYGCGFDLISFIRSNICSILSRAECCHMIQ